MPCWSDQKGCIASFRIGRGDTTTTCGTGCQQSYDDHMCGHRAICPLRVLAHGYQRWSGRENVLPANAKCQRHSTGNSLCASLLTCGTTWHYSYLPSLVKILTTWLDANACIQGGKHGCLTAMVRIWVSVRLTDMIAVSLYAWSLWLQFVVETRDSANVSTLFHMVW